MHDEKLKQRLQDPEVMARVEEILDQIKQIKRGDPLNPGITAEELPDFLRKYEPSS